MNNEQRKLFETRALARMATAIENREPAALSMLDMLEPGHARIVGITGPPGAGKSTLVNALATELRREGKTIAIIAVDPSSRKTGGAILGDRIRMQQHYADPGIFIRSTATRGNIGGVARTTADLVRLMDAAGRDYVIIETVGVGQDEVEIAGLAQVTVVVLVPGMGDDIQAIKAGIMEIADIFVINKADQPGADRVELELHAEAPNIPILRTVATEGTGVSALLAALDPAIVSRGGADFSLRGASAPQPAAHLDHIGTLAPESTVPELVDALRLSRDRDSPLASEGAVPPQSSPHLDHIGTVATESTGAAPPHALGGADSPHFDHLGIVVPALDAAIAFYETLGLAVTHRETVATEKVHVAMLPAGDSRIELLEPASTDSPISKFLEKRGPGLHHIALKVPDLPAAVERLRASGARLLNEPRQGAGGHLYVFVHPASTGGVLLELIQESAH